MKNLYNLDMEDSHSFASVLGVFSHYGFKKASMEDLAQAMGFTRQTLYNHFKGKQAVLDWAVEGYVRDSHSKAIEELKGNRNPVPDGLLGAFSRMVGDIVPLLKNSPHGSEVLDMGTESLKRSNIDHQGAFEKELARFLVERGACQTIEEATEKTFLLLMASKGLLLKCQNSEEFQDGMARIIRVAVKP